MKKIYLILFLFNASPLFSQDWIKYYGYGQNPTAKYCIEHYDKGYLLAGSLFSVKYGWLVKTDINGNQLWDIKIGDGIHTTEISNVERTNDNGMIVSGSTTLYNPPHTDPFIIKLNSCGELEWCHVLVYDNTGDGGIMVKPTNDGGYILLAEFFGNDPNDRIRMFKFDSGGELFWTKIYNRDSLVHSEILCSLYVDSANFLITAFCYYPNWMKPYYIQTDTSGNETWRLAYSQHTGLGYVGDAWSTIRDKHGNYYSTGRREISSELLKFSREGYEMMNVDLFPTAQSGASRTILLLNDTSCVVDASWSFNGSTNYFGIIKTDTLGNIKNIKYLPDPSNSGAVWSTKTFDNKILLVGMNFIGANSRIELFKFNSSLEFDSIYSKTYTYDSLCPNTIVSHTISLNCGVLVGADDHLNSPETTFLKVFPNPANQKLTVEFPKCLVVKTGLSGFGSTTVYHQWKSTILEIFDLSGKKIFEKEIVRAETFLEIDVSQWPRGIYNFNLQYNEQIVANKKVAVQ